MPYLINGIETCSHAERYQVKVFLIDDIDRLIYFSNSQKTKLIFDKTAEEILKLAFTKRKDVKMVYESQSWKRRYRVLTRIERSGENKNNWQINILTFLIKVSEYI